MDQCKVYRVCPVCKQVVELEDCPNCIDSRRREPDPDCTLCHGSGLWGMCNQWHEEKYIAAFERGKLFWWLYLALSWFRIRWYEIEFPVERCSGCGKLTRVLMFYTRHNYDQCLPF